MKNTVIDTMLRWCYSVLVGYPVQRYVLESFAMSASMTLSYTCKTAGLASCFAVFMPFMHGRAVQCCVVLCPGDKPVTRWGVSCCHACTSHAVLEAWIPNVQSSFQQLMHMVDTS
jgi:hypothetical protein